jgi:hypothetical protein
MTTRTPNLRGLIALAKRDGVDIRPTLVRVITDLFVQEPVHSPAEVERYVELARHMLEGVDEASRHAVAMKLARYPRAPREILMMLAADTLEVAEPVLSQANFAEADLLRLVGTLDEARRRIIAGRADLPASVAARLADATSAAPALARRPETPSVAKEAIAKDIAAKDIAAKVAAAKEAGLKDRASHEVAPPSSEWERPLGLTVTPATAKPAAESLPGWMTKAVEPPAPVAVAPAKPAAPPKPATPPVAAKPAAQPLPSWMTKPAERPAPAVAAPSSPATPPVAAKPVAKPAAQPITKPIAEPMPLPSWMTKPADSAVPATSTPPKVAASAADAKPAPLPSWMTKPVVAAPAATLAPAASPAPVAPPAAAAAPSTRAMPNLAGSAFAIADLEQAALQRKPEEFIDRLARIFEIDRAKAEEVVRDPTGQSVAVACRALDMSCDVFSRIVLFLDPTIGRSVALVFSLAEYYGRLSVAEANEVVASWRSPKRATAPRHQPFTAPDGAGRHSFEPRRATPPLPGASRIAARG